LHLSVPLYYSGCRVGWQYVWVARIYCNLLMQVFYLWACVLVLYLSVCIVIYFKYKYRGRMNIIYSYMIRWLQTTIFSLSCGMYKISPIFSKKYRSNIFLY